MRIRYSDSGTGSLVLTRPEYDVLPEEAKKRLKQLAMNRHGECGGFGFDFYGGMSLDLALEVCRYHHLLLDTYRFKETV